MTLEEMDAAYEARQEAITIKEKGDIFKRVSKHAIKNALTSGSVPLSGITHGPFKMTPPKLLHISGGASFCTCFPF